MFHTKWYNDVSWRIANEQDFFNEHKNVYNESWSELVKSEIFRQRDKSNNNSIGYFHQRMFQYISGCRVPDNGKEGGWDVIYENSNGIILPEGDIVHTIYVEMKNKHNTMNSASAGKT